ncbi:MAG: L-aspartate oxidase [Rhodospirillaceae bacterium]|nr:L-aspartate oxidase [Rhodospirillaceae bacterium]
MAEKATIANYVTDVAIIGSGAAGLTAALQLDPKTRVTVLSKGGLESGSTEWAQGGIAAVIDEEDSVESHIADTIDAGAGLCDPEAVRFIVENGAEAIHRLDALGVKFTREPGSNTAYHLTREGGHSHRRIVHVADATGKAVETTLAGQVRKRKNIDVLEHFTAVDLITEAGGDGEIRCAGFYALDQRENRVVTFAARTVILATGGASKVYLYTSNPDGNSGDGMAMAWRAGCRVANMEFTQFHPTCLFHPQAKSFLITEAVRGEGGRLLLPGGEPFAEQFDARAELAPRDIVARAIDHEMKRLGVDCVYLDISHQPADFIVRHFPMVYARCLQFGFDMTKEPIPVVPAAHYSCGGVMTDLAGRTDIAGLYAVGEVAYTGLHGANRVASNSLLECLVLATAAGKDIAGNIHSIDLPEPVTDWDESWVRDSDEEIVVSHNWDEIRRFMWDYVGIVRTTKRLQRAQARVQLLSSEIMDYYQNFRVDNNLLELRNLAIVADLIIRSAMERKESRGIHYTLDYPETGTPTGPTILTPETRA